MTRADALAIQLEAALAEVEMLKHSLTSLRASIAPCLEDWPEDMLPQLRSWTEYVSSTLGE